MKKAGYAVAVAVLVVAILGYGIITSNAYIDEANASMDIGGFKLLTEESAYKDVLKKDFASVGAFGANVYRNQIDGTEVVFGGFPDVLDRYRLIGVATTNPAHRLYGIGAGDRVAKAEEILRQNGFKKAESDSTASLRVFRKKRLSVAVTLNEGGVITGMRIGLTATNKKHVIF